MPKPGVGRIHPRTQLGSHYPQELHRGLLCRSIGGLKEWLDQKRSGTCDWVRTSPCLFISLQGQRPPRSFVCATQTKWRKQFPVQISLVLFLMRRAQWPCTVGAVAMCKVYGCFTPAQVNGCCMPVQVKGCCSLVKSRCIPAQVNGRYGPVQFNITSDPALTNTGRRGAASLALHPKQSGGSSFLLKRPSSCFLCVGAASQTTKASVCAPIPRRTLAPSV